MTLDEAIAHAREVAKELKKKAELADNTDLNYTSDYCLDCAKEHEQLAEWLEELKARREQDKKGHWIESGVDISGHRLNRCSICNEVYQMSYVGDASKRWNFCPNCKADMRGLETLTESTRKRGNK